MISFTESPLWKSVLALAPLINLVQWPNCNSYRGAKLWTELATSSAAFKKSIREEHLTFLFSFVMVVTRNLSYKLDPNILYNSISLNLGISAFAEVNL